MYIETIKLLEFLVKAQKLSILNSFRQYDDGYEIVLRYDWPETGSWYNQTVFITNKGESTWDYGDYEFYQMNDILDKMLEEKEQKEIKKQKRKELIARLTEEEKELLGIQ